MKAGGVQDQRMLYINIYTGIQILHNVKHAKLQLFSMVIRDILLAGLQEKDSCITGTTLALHQVLDR